MLTSHDHRIDALLRELVIEPHVAPGACAAVSIRRRNEWVTLMGQSGQFAPDDPTRTNLATWFDLASLTKPVVALCLARFADRGRLRLDRPLADYLPWTTGCAARDTSLESLLAHRSGLRAHIELFAPLRDGARFDPEQALRQAANGLADERQPLPGGGFEVIYSDLGFLLLGKVLEAVSGDSLDRVLQAELHGLGIYGIGSVRCLGLDGTGQVAPTETVAWRGGRICAMVHDDNAFALSGSGCSGHAGLFGRVGSVVRFAQLMLDARAERHAVLTRDALDSLFQQRPGGSHLAGFDGKSDSGSSAGDVLGPQTFGHLGFTGTSFWCDPSNDIAVVLLTNRVCPSRDNIAIRAVRPQVHDALARLGLSSRSTEELLRTTGQ